MYIKYARVHFFLFANPLFFVLVTHPKNYRPPNSLSYDDDQLTKLCEYINQTSTRTVDQLRGEIDTLRIKLEKVVKILAVLEDKTVLKPQPTLLPPPATEMEELQKFVDIPDFVSFFIIFFYVK